MFVLAGTPAGEAAKKASAVMTIETSLAKASMDVTARRDPPFDGALPREVTRDAHWVEPTMVGEVAYALWTADGRLRHPSWRGIRDDIDPDDVVVEW